MKRVSLSIIVPAYNEEKTILIVLKSLIKQRSVAEIIVVNDGSTDKTAQKIKTFKHKKIKLHSKPNGGKGSAIRYGLEKVTGSHVLIQDADLEYDPEDIPALLKPIKKGKAQVVYGSRFMGPHLNLLFWHRVGNDFLNFLINILYNTTLSDMESCYKVIPTKVFRQLRLSANFFDIEPEITCKLLKQGFKIYEVPISYVGRDFSEGKKINWYRDGLGALWTIIKYRLLP